MGEKKGPLCLRAQLAVALPLLPVDRRRNVRSSKADNGTLRIPVVRKRRAGWSRRTTVGAVFVQSSAALENSTCFRTPPGPDRWSDGFSEPMEYGDPVCSGDRTYGASLDGLDFFMRSEATALRVSRGFGSHTQGGCLFLRSLSAEAFAISFRHSHPTSLSSLVPAISLHQSIGIPYALVSLFIVLVFSMASPSTSWDGVLRRPNDPTAVHPGYLVIMSLSPGMPLDNPIAWFSLSASFSLLSLDGPLPCHRSRSVPAGLSSRLRSASPSARTGALPGFAPWLVGLCKPVVGCKGLAGIRPPVPVFLPWSLRTAVGTVQLPLVAFIARYTRPAFLTLNQARSPGDSIKREQPEFDHGRSFNDSARCSIWMQFFQPSSAPARPIASFSSSSTVTYAASPTIPLQHRTCCTRDSVRTKAAKSIAIHRISLRLDLVTTISVNLQRQTHQPALRTPITAPVDKTIGSARPLCIGSEILPSAVAEADQVALVPGLLGHRTGQDLGRDRLASRETGKGLLPSLQIRVEKPPNLARLHFDQFAMPTTSSAHSSASSRSQSRLDSVSASQTRSPPGMHVQDSSLFATSYETTPNQSERSDDTIAKLGLDAEEGNADDLSSGTGARLLSGVRRDMQSSCAPPVSGHDSLGLGHGQGTSAHAFVPEQGVSPVISAFRSPYPPSPTYFVTVVPPLDFPFPADTARSDIERIRRGSLLPLYPTLGGQLWAISREYALPSVGGLMIYLADDGQGNQGPKVGDSSWQALWSRFFADDEMQQPFPPFKAHTFAPSRRCSGLPNDAYVDPSSSLSYTQGLPRSTTIGNAIDAGAPFAYPPADHFSARPSLGYVSSRPSPRLEPTASMRRDHAVPMEWSPSARSATWSGPASFSTGRRAAQVASPLPHVPIVTKLEWIVDEARAPWWPTWVEARRQTTKDRPIRVDRKSMHLEHQHAPSSSLQVSASPVNEPQEDAVSSRSARLDVGNVLDSASRDPEDSIATQSHVSRSSSAAAEHAERALPTDVATDSLKFTVPDTENAEEVELTSINDHQSSASVSSAAPSVSLQVASRRMSELHEASVPRPESFVAPRSQTPASDPVLEPSEATLDSHSSISSSTRPGRPGESSQSLISHRSGERSDSASECDSEDSYGNHSEQDASYAEIVDDEDQIETRAVELDTAADSQHRDVFDPNLDFVVSGEDEDMWNALRRPTSLAPRDVETSDFGVVSRHFKPEVERLGEDDTLLASPVAQEAAGEPVSKLPESSFAAPTSAASESPSAASASAHDVRTPPATEAAQLPVDEGRSVMGSIQIEEPALEQDANIELEKRDLDTGAAQTEQVETLQHLEGYRQEPYFSPQRSNVARIQSWIGKTPRAAPGSTGFEDDFNGELGGDHVNGAESHDTDFDPDLGLDMARESDIDEVVGLWASKVRQDPFGVPHIEAPPAQHTEPGLIQRKAHTLQSASAAAHAPEWGSSLHSDAATTAGAELASLLSPIHLDAAAFGGVRPSLGNLSHTPVPPQVLSPSSPNSGMLSTPRVSASHQHSEATALPPSSPASLAPPENRRPSFSRRSSGDISDTLEEMEKALELLSPGCSPNPGSRLSPNPDARKMSSRDSLAYARSISASVTPSPKWLARSRASSSKGRSQARKTFVAGGSPFVRENVSPRPASTSAVSSSKRSASLNLAGMRAPLSASRLVGLAREEAGPTNEMLAAQPAEAHDEDDTDSSAPSSVPTFSDDEHAKNDKEDGDGKGSALAYEMGVGPANACVTGSVAEAQAGTASNEAAPTALATGVLRGTEPSDSKTEQGAKPDAHHTDHDSVDDVAALAGDDHDNGIASIQRFLRGKVVSGSSDHVQLDDSQHSDANQLDLSSGEGTVIEHSLSQSGSFTSVAASTAAFPLPSVTDNVTLNSAPTMVSAQSEAVLGKDGSLSDERWSQMSYKASPAVGSNASSKALPLLPAEAESERGAHDSGRDSQFESGTTTTDTQLSPFPHGMSSISVTVDEALKSYMTSSPSDEAFFKTPSSPGQQPLEFHRSVENGKLSGTPSYGLPVPPPADHSQHAQALSPVVGPMHANLHENDADVGVDSSSTPALSYLFSTSPYRSEGFPDMGFPQSAHDYSSMDEAEIRAMNEDTRAAVRDALSNATSRHTTGLMSGTASSRDTTSPTSPMSTASSLSSELLRRHGSSSSLYALVSQDAPPQQQQQQQQHDGASVGVMSSKHRPARLNLDVDGLARSPPSGHHGSSTRRLPSNSPKARFRQLPPSPSLHPSYKASMSSPLSTSFPITSPHLGSPQGRSALPTLPSVTSIQSDLC
ncbi:hypothetical protein BCV70DRAFT_203434 [Testicularia cyperi]|uniref:Uncharacterized protein n=1 Tax=Testicularia cyperi TaxID=1882483 RepID=A0A317XW06_9BASI|nr:hypothetical protein BCV70DRAFT_203434 [Testicularia cyperi]